eukprot:scaffold34956_cov17-Tisochrysis_lutea.AAC.1
MTLVMYAHTSQQSSMHAPKAGTHNSKAQGMNKGTELWNLLPLHFMGLAAASDAPMALFVGPAVAPVAPVALQELARMLLEVRATLCAACIIVGHLFIDAKAAALAVQDLLLINHWLLRIIL